jgi:hypothetical protein
MSSGVFEDLKSAIAGFGALLADWFLAALNPAKECNRILAFESDSERIREALKLWVASFVVSLFVFLPLYAYYGIGLKALEFHLPIFLFLTLGMIGCGLCLWLSFRIYGIPAAFSDSISVYTAYVMCYQPVLNLFCYFASFRFFGFLASVKAQGLDIPQAAHYLATQSFASTGSPDFIYFGSRISSWLLLPFFCASSALMASTIAARCSVPRRKSFSAVVFGTMVLFPLVAAIQSMLIVFTEYVFISAKGVTALPN